MLWCILAFVVVVPMVYLWGAYSYRHEIPPMPQILKWRDRNPEPIGVEFDKYRRLVAYPEKIEVPCARRSSCPSALGAASGRGTRTTPRPRRSALYQTARTSSLAPILMRLCSKMTASRTATSPQPARRSSPPSGSIDYEGYVKARQSLSS